MLGFKHGQVSSQCFQATILPNAEREDIVWDVVQANFAAGIDGDFYAKWFKAFDWDNDLSTRLQTILRNHEHQMPREIVKTGRLRKTETGMEIELDRRCANQVAAAPDEPNRLERFAIEQLCITFGQ